MQNPYQGRFLAHAPAAPAHRGVAAIVPPSQRGLPALPTPPLPAIIPLVAVPTIGMAVAVGGMMEAARMGPIASDLRVRYAETDAMGVVYYANYLIWFELGRTDWIRAHGVTYRQFEEQGILLPVIHASCDYRSSARYDDLVRIETTVVALTRARVSFAYRVLRVEPVPVMLLAEGRTEHVFLTREGRPMRLDRQSPFWIRLASAYATTGTAEG